MSGSAEIYEAVFAFDASWEGFARTAVFECAGERREQLLVNDRCIVPWEILHAGAYLRVGVYGVSGNATMPTVYSGTMFVARGAEPSEAAREHSPDVFDQIVEIGDKAAQDAESAANSAEAAAGSATDAAGSATDANAAKTAAQAAQTASEGARDTAQGAAATATSQATAAAGSATAAAGSATAAETAQTGAGTAESNAETAATNAQNSAEDSEAYAVGTRGGEDVPSTDPAYHNNAKYYAERAETELSPVKYVPQTLTDAQKAQARQNINAAAPDGYYGTSGGVYQYATNFLGKNAATEVKDLVYRPTASEMSGTSWQRNSVSGDTATVEKIKGKTLLWNQVVPNGNFANGLTKWGSTTGCTVVDGVLNSNGRLGPYQYISSRAHNGDIVYARVDVKLQSDPLNKVGLAGIGGGISIRAANILNQWQTLENVLRVSGSAPYAGLYDERDASLRDNVQWRNCYVLNLTKMFGAGNEPTTLEEFYAIFSPADYYEYNEGELLSFNGTGLQTTGFNQLDGEGHISVIGGLTYRIEGTYTSLVDSDGNTVTVTDGEFTPTKNDTYTMVGGECVHIKWSGIRDGETESYWQRQLALPIAQYFPDGMKSAGTVYDELMKDKAVQRVGSRAYQEGDEADETAITDGTTTYYPLDTPVETPITPELNLTYKADDFGTERLLPENTGTLATAPMDADIIYQIDYEAQVRNLDTIIGTQIETAIGNAIGGSY